MYQTFKIDLDDKIFEIPVFKIGDSKGKKLVITAGSRVLGNLKKKKLLLYQLFHSYSLNQ